MCQNYIYLFLMDLKHARQQNHAEAARRGRDSGKP
jgi:hypothetical protein